MHYTVESLAGSGDRNVSDGIMNGRSRAAKFGPARNPEGLMVWQGCSQPRNPGSSETVGLARLDRRSW